MTAVLSETISDNKKRLSYHHGNLRDALLAAALEILAAEGIDGLSLRALAKATGVTQAAPYSHFRDKDDLLAAVAEGGFQRLALQMAEDATGADSTALRIERLMTSYIHFATSNKPLFGIMFGREISDMKKYPTLAMTAGKSYALISAALSRQPGGAESARFLSLAIWSLCHGLTTLIIEEKISPAQFGAADMGDFVRKNLALFADQLA